MDLSTEAFGVTAAAAAEDQHLEMWDWGDTTHSRDLGCQRLPGPIEPMPVNKLRLAEAIKLVCQEGLLIFAAPGETQGDF